MSTIRLRRNLKKRAAIMFPHLNICEIVFQEVVGAPNLCTCGATEKRRVWTAIHLKVKVDGQTWTEQTLENQIQPGRLFLTRFGDEWVVAYVSRDGKLTLSHGPDRLKLGDLMSLIDRLHALVQIVGRSKDNL